MLIRLLQCKLSSLVLFSLSCIVIFRGPWELFYAFLPSADFFSKSTFSKNSFTNTIRVLNSLDLDQAWHFQTVWHSDIIPERIVFWKKSVVNNKSMNNYPACRVYIDLSCWFKTVLSGFELILKRGCRYLKMLCTQYAY